MTPPKSSALNASTLWQLTAGSLRVLKLIGRLGCAEGETAFFGPLQDPPPDPSLPLSEPFGPSLALTWGPKGPILGYGLYSLWAPSHGLAGRYPHYLFKSSKVHGINNKACSCSSSSI